jgi:8-oxo-dGTP diphosphatase
VTLYLVRHAKAGDRREWAGDDRLRPLSRRGQRQAEGLVELLADRPVDRVLSSPYVRCMETVVPLAGMRNLAVEPCDALAEEAPLDAVLALVRKHADEDAVLCSHGDVIPMLLDHLARRGVDLGPHPIWPKGCTWELETEGDEIVAARYVPPPPD